MKVKKSVAINYFGNANKTAKALNVTRSWVGQWGDYMPPYMAFKFREIQKKDKAKKARKKK